MVKFIAASDGASCAAERAEMIGTTAAGCAATQATASVAGSTESSRAIPVRPRTAPGIQS